MVLEALTFSKHGCNQSGMNQLHTVGVSKSWSWGTFFAGYENHDRGRYIL